MMTMTKTECEMSPENKLATARICRDLARSILAVDRSAKASRRAHRLVARAQMFEAAAK